MAKGLLPAIRDFLFGKSEGKPASLRAAYDIAQTTPDNARQWERADNLDADASDSPGVRQIARKRSRHETQNNPTLTGIVRTLTHYEIGIGPTLHVDANDAKWSAEVESKWAQWCDAVNLPGKLRQMVYGRVVDGEAFARIGQNPNLHDPVKTDFQPFECDRCYTLWLPYLTPYRIDGIWFDVWGNPTYYDILQYHPGGVFPMPTWKFDTVPAQYILHLYQPERANQHRGMPELMSSTELFSDRRRHRKATVAAAESAANVAAFLTTNQPADDGYAPEAGSMTSMPRNSLVVAPDGYDMKQIDARHPNQTYEMFASETLNEAARPVSMALNVAKCDSSRYNFAGGRLDIITSWKAVEVNQSNNTWRVVNPLFRAWYAEARLIYGWQAKDGGEVPDHHFLWVGMPYSDPEAEQAADEAAIKSGLKGIQEVYARRGKDWNVQKDMNARAMGMSADEYIAFILANLETQKGGMQGDKPADGKPETPAAVKAKFAAMFPSLAARLNGHFLAANRGKYDAPANENDGVRPNKASARKLISDDWLAKRKKEILTLSDPVHSDAIDVGKGIFGSVLGVVNGHKVVAIEADEVMLKHDPDFVVAGNHERWEFIPADQFWIDHAYSPHEVAHDLLHEAVETEIMSTLKWEYDDAHEYANACELAFMRELGKAAKLADKEAAK